MTTYRVCKKCGKAGPLEKNWNNENYHIKHYCPVKQKERTAKKQKELRDSVSRTIKNFEASNQYYFGTWSPEINMLVDAFPYDESGLWEPPSPQEILFRKVLLEFNIKCIEWMKEKQKFPGKVQYKRFIKELLEKYPQS